MERKTVQIKETGTKFTTGEVFRPSWSDVKAILGKLRRLGLEEDLVPFYKDRGRDTIESVHETNIRNMLRSRSLARKVVPDMLARAEFRGLHKKAPFAVLACLWVLACWHYKVNGGPYPGTPKKYKAPRRRPVNALTCPYCGKEYMSEIPDTNREEVLETYAQWLVEHEECNNGEYIELSPEVE